MYIFYQNTHFEKNTENRPTIYPVYMKCQLSTTIVILSIIIDINYANDIIQKSNKRKYLILLIEIISFNLDFD